MNGFGDGASDVDVVLSASKASLTEGLGLGRVSKKDPAARDSRVESLGFRV